MTAVQKPSILIDLGGRGGLVALPRLRRDAALAYLLAPVLDRRLAAGSAPESSRLLAVRAVQLTSPRSRRRLARCWDELAARARGPRPPFDPRAPIARRQVDAAADAIHQVAEVLRASRPVSAQGVALAASLLTSPDSPVYRLGRGGDDLAGAIARAVATL